MGIEEVLKKYFSESTKISFRKLGQGAINSTYLVDVKEGDTNTNYVLQKMNPIFDVSVMEDIDAITKHLASKNILTQKVINALDGGLFVKDDQSWWRLLSFIPGSIIEAVSSKAQAYEAGRFTGLFHTALLDCKYEFKFKLLHFHDVPFYVDELRSVLLRHKDTDKYDQLNILAKEVLELFDQHYKNVSLPKRIIHDDLKINNILFDESGKHAIAVLDLDTFTEKTLAIELGDALRSWCMPGGEDTEEAHFDLDIYNSALDGYYSTAKFITEEEKESIPYGVKLISMGSMARFVTDAFNESYYKLDSSKYKNLFEQNKKKAENQFAFYKEFSKIF